MYRRNNERTTNAYSGESIMKQICPVCQGHGLVPQGFYMYPAGQEFSTTNASPETCRACLGTGVVETN